jgi:DNA-binding XRE family transcriptional regulator
MSTRRSRSTRRKPGLRTVRLDANQIISWRLGQQISQKEAAAACGIGQVTYWRCEHGKPIWTLCAARVSAGLGIPLSKLLN